MPLARRPASAQGRAGLERARFWRLYVGLGGIAVARRLVERSDLCHHGDHSAHDAQILGGVRGLLAAGAGPSQWRARVAALHAAERPGDFARPNARLASPVLLAGAAGRW